MNNYYVYVYLDVTRPGIYEYEEYRFDWEPFYVGKGKIKRDVSHLKRASSMKEGVTYSNGMLLVRINEVRKSGYDPKVVRVWEELGEKDAYCIESKMIKTIGLFIDGKGPLLNKMHSSHYDISRKVETPINLYLLNHPYVSISPLTFTSWKVFHNFCSKKGLNEDTLIRGGTSDGWSLDIIS